MLRSLFISFFVLISVNELNAQYTYRGRAFKKLTGEFMTMGDVRARIGASRESRRGTKIAQIDSFGYFSITLKDSANVLIGVDCGFEGYDYKTISYNDTLIIFKIGVLCSNYNIETAKRDIKENKLRLLFNGLISDLPKSKADEEFEKKYSIKYVNFLDVPEWNDCIRLYNGEIGHFLDEKFGKSWRNEVKHQIEFY